MNTKIRALTLVGGIIIAAIFIYTNTRKKVNFEDFALGPATSSVFAQKDGFPIHLSKFQTNKINQLKNGWVKRGEKDVLLVLGNSQTHGINQYSPGQVTYNSLLFDSLQSKHLDVLTVSMPNANLQEMLLSFSYMIENFPVKYLVIPLFMDDLREDGIREVFFTNQIKTRYSIRDTSKIAHKINSQLNDFNSKVTKEANAGSDMAALNETVQEKSEKFLNTQLNRYSQSWRERPNLRGKIFTNLYLLRNTVFGISAQTKRPMIKKRYENNLSAYQSILRIAHKNNIKVLAYIPPIRNDVEIPYVLDEYERFKTQIKAITTSYPNTTFVNLEQIVPAQYWGVKGSTNLFGKEELDFMHFKYEGHLLLFDNLMLHLNKILNKNDI